MLTVYALCLLAMGFFELLLQVNFTFSLLSAIIIGLFSITLGHEIGSYFDKKLNKESVGFEEIESSIPSTK